MGITAGSREVPGRKGLWQEMMMMIIIIIIIIITIIIIIIIIISTTCTSVTCTFNV